MAAGSPDPTLMLPVCQRERELGAGGGGSKVKKGPGRWVAVSMATGSPSRPHPPHPPVSHPGVHGDVWDPACPNPPQGSLLFGYKPPRCLGLGSPLMVTYLRALSGSPAEAVRCEGVALPRWHPGRMCVCIITYKTLPAPR